MRKRTRGSHSAPALTERASDLQEIEERVNAAWAFIGIMRPEFKPAEKQSLAELVLNLCNSFDPSAQPRSHLQISAAQVTEVIWRNSQCIQKSCPMLLFSDQIAEELNDFFIGDG